MNLSQSSRGRARRFLSPLRNLTPALNFGLNTLRSEGYEESAASDFLEPFRRFTEIGDRKKFVEQVRSSDLAQRTPKEVLQLIQLSLGLEMFQLASELALKAGSLFPDHEKVREVTCLLAPPTVHASEGVPIVGLKESQKWFQDNLDRYQGKWAAVRAGELLGVADSLKELMRKLGTDFDRHNTIIAKVL